MCVCLPARARVLACACACLPGRSMFCVRRLVTSVVCSCMRLWGVPVLKAHTLMERMLGGTLLNKDPLSTQDRISVMIQ